MEEKEFKQLMEQFKEQATPFVASEIKKATEGLITTDELNKSIEGLATKEVIDKLSEAVEKQGLEINKFFEGKKEDKTLNQILYENKDKYIEAAKSKRSHEIIIDKTTVQRSAISGDTQAMRLPGVGQLAYGSVGFDQLFRPSNVAPNSHGVVRYVDQSSVTRNAAATAEAAAYPESAIAWIERTLNLEKITDSIPISMESLEDIDFVEGEVRRLLDINLMIEMNQQFWSGTGSTPQIQGLYSNSNITTFDSAAYAASTKPKADNAGLYDLLAILRVELMNNKQSKYAPNIAVMNPSDILRMKLQKDEFGQYVIPPFAANDGAIVDGMVVYENSVVTQNTMLIGDFRYGTKFVMGGVKVEIGWVNDQFTKDLMTIKAHERTALLVRNVDADAFTKVTNIDTAISNITTVAG